MRFKKVESCDLLLKEDPRVVEEQLIDYVIYNREELKIASNCISTKIAPIRKFYECNDIELRWKKIKSYIGRNKGKGGVGRKKDRPCKWFIHLKFFHIFYKLGLAMTHLQYYVLILL
jgi:hypothetical protein